MPAIKKYKMYKKYDLDIWGFLGKSKFPSKTLNYIFLRYKLNYKIWGKIKLKKFLLSKESQKFIVKFSKPREKPIILKNRTNKTKANRIKMEHIVRLYYGINNKKIFRHIRKRRKSKVFFSSVILELEMRLESIIRRLQLNKSIFVIRELIRKGYFFVNGVKITNPYHTIDLFSIITIDHYFLQSNILPSYFFNLNENKIKSAIPSHLYTDMSQGIIIVIGFPEAKELVWPFINHKDVIATC